MAGAAVAFVLTADDVACRRAGAALFVGVPLLSLDRAALRPTTPFEGPLFELLAAQPRDTCAGLVVPALWVGPAGDGRDEAAREERRVHAAGAPRVAGGLVAIADHVGLEARGPLTGRWPAGVPRAFPSMTGIYQPRLVRSLEGARVYSFGVVVAGVADVRRLTRFEARAVREEGWSIVSDSLVPVAVVAAYYGIRLAACGVVQAPRSDRE